VRVMRIDPSKPEAERITLLKVDGRAPTAAQVQQWRDEGRDASATLGDLPPLGNVVNFDDLRVFSDGESAIVFEAAVRSGGDKLQALFRVNKARRFFEEINVKMREAVRVAGVVNITEAGLRVQFKTIDPLHLPQPVELRAGGAARVLLVKVSRAFEAKRTDFQRVDPYEEPVPGER